MCDYFIPDSWRDEQITRYINDRMEREKEKEVEDGTEDEDQGGILEGDEGRVCPNSKEYRYDTRSH